jgi:hypothetical protein
VIAPPGAIVLDEGKAEILKSNAATALGIKDKKAKIKKIATSVPSNLLRFITPILSLLLNKNLVVYSLSSKK